MLEQLFQRACLRRLVNIEQGAAGRQTLLADVAPHNFAPLRPTLRTAAVFAFREALADPSGAPADVRFLWRSIGYCEKELGAAFEDVDDLIVAIAEHTALLMTQPLRDRGCPRDVDVASDTLVAFGLTSWNEYSTTLVGLVRLLATEGKQNPLLKKRVYEAGPAFVTGKLREFLSEAEKAGILRVSSAQMHAEQLMGMLREPLYQALIHLLPPKRAASVHVQASIQRFVHGCGYERGGLSERD